MDDQMSMGQLRLGGALFVANVFKVVEGLTIVGTGVAPSSAAIYKLIPPVDGSVGGMRRDRSGGE
jgi:hypothetical protein